MDQQRLLELIEKFKANTASEAEIQELDGLYREFDRKPGYVDSLDESQKETYKEMIYARISAQINPEEALPEVRELVIQRPLWPRIAAAASIILVLSFGGYVLFHKPSTQQFSQNKNDIAPGGTKAILTLANGQKIVLNDQHKGKIASQGRTAIMLDSAGRVAYKAVSGHSAETVYNTLTVPIGNHRDMTLADGTEVSLDAGSSITYPVVFNAKERKVSITGQVLFRVKYDARKPFYTQAKSLIMQDLGTEFNVNAYDDEPSIKTTLVEGSVKVGNTILKPGEQAVAKNNDAVIMVTNADVAAVTAWKNNDFLFRNQGLRTTMRQIARWYDVNIIYDNPPEHLRIWADVSRSRNLSVLLKAIENTGKVKFKIEGRNVHVTQ